MVAICALGLLIGLVAVAAFRGDIMLKRNPLHAMDEFAERVMQENSKKPWQG